VKGLSSLLEKKIKIWKSAEWLFY